MAERPALRLVEPTVRREGAVIGERWLRPKWEGMKVGKWEGGFAKVRT